MEPVLPFIVLIVVGVGIAVSLSGGNRWKEVAAQLGLHYSGGFQRTMSGSIDGFRIRLSQQKHHIDILLSGDGAIRDTIKLTEEGFLSGILGGRDIEIGCPAFDANTYISSVSRNSEAEVSALLDDKTRAVVSRVVVKGGAKVAGGNITHAKTNSIDEIPSVVNALVELGRHLSMKISEIPGRLASNARQDRLSSVRLRNLTLLQERYPDRSEATGTSAALLVDPHHSIRLAAAMFMGRDGLAVVQEVALSRRAMVDVRIKALEHLVQKAGREDMIEIAGTLLADQSDRLQRMAIQCLGRLQHRPSLEPIIALLDRQDIATSLEVVKAIESIGDPTAESALIELLGDSPNRLRTAAIEALAQIGTINAVETLHGLTKRRGFKRSARNAISSIQSRLGDVESGRLSLAPALDPDGALSLAGDPEKAGGLSLDEEDEAT